MTTDKMPCHITDGPPSNDPADDGWITYEECGQITPEQWALLPDLKLGTGANIVWTEADATRELRDALNDIAATQIDVYYSERDDE